LDKDETNGIDSLLSNNKIVRYDAPPYSIRKDEQNEKQKVEFTAGEPLDKDESNRLDSLISN
jgi:hypothetical protein